MQNPRSDTRGFARLQGVCGDSWADEDFLRLIHGATKSGQLAKAERGPCEMRLQVRTQDVYYGVKLFKASPLRQAEVDLLYSGLLGPQNSTVL